MEKNSNLKLAMYSHDTFGLGHIRRTLLISEYLSKAFSKISTLIISGSSMIHSMRIPSNVDYIKVPCLTKKSNNHYLPKYLTHYPGGVIRIRKEIIFNTLKEYQPDFFIVDKTPEGTMGELRKSLHYMKENMPDTKIVLGIRDILDNPDHIRKEWEGNGTFDLIDKCYDEIWVYGVKEIYNVIEEYQLPPSVTRKVHFCGYLKRQKPLRDSEEIKKQLGMKDKQMVLMTLGGGGDGHDIVDVFIKSLSELSVQRDIGGLIVTGPDFSNDKLNSIIQVIRSGQEIIVKEYTTDILEYMNAADLVVSMAGYNTICEILSLNKKSIVIPRVNPRTEQLIRAVKLSGLGLLKVITPLELSSAVLKDEIVKALSSRQHQSPLSDLIDFNGLDNIKRRFKILMNSTSDLCSSKSMNKSVPGPIYNICDSKVEGDFR
jgi:predicted glycosyltransferase